MENSPDLHRKGLRPASNLERRVEIQLVRTGRSKADECLSHYPSTHPKGKQSNQASSSLYPQPKQNYLPVPEPQERAELNGLPCSNANICKMYLPLPSIKSKQTQLKSSAPGRAIPLNRLQSWSTFLLF